jgi:hypothetical protein
MEAKGYIRRDHTRDVRMFAAVLGRDSLIGCRIHSVGETACDNTHTPRVTHLARTHNLTDEDRLT